MLATPLGARMRLCSPNERRGRAAATPQLCNFDLVDNPRPEGSNLTEAHSPAGGRRVQAWMSSWIAVGAAQDAVLPILIPAYVIAVTGSASYSGVVMGVLMLTGALGPALGRLADRYRAHRVVLVLGNFGLALACVAYGLSSERDAILILDAVLLGASISAVSTVAPVFVLSARLEPKLEANRLTTLNLTQPVGQMLLGGALAAAAAARWSFPARFYLAAAILAVFAVLVWLTSAGPARNIHVETSPAGPGKDKGEPVAATKPKVLTAEFGLVLGVAFLTSVAFQSVVGQMGNILPEVFGFSQTGTASLVSTAGLVAIGVFFLAGRVLQTKGAAATMTIGVLASSVRHPRSRDRRRGADHADRDRFSAGAARLRVQLLRRPCHLPARRASSLGARLGGIGLGIRRHRARRCPGIRAQRRARRRFRLQLHQLVGQPRRSRGGAPRACRESHQADATEITARGAESPLMSLCALQRMARPTSGCSSRRSVEENDT